jgi:hypothetical protein
MLNANLISERRYIQMKDNGVSEDWKTNVAAGLHQWVLWPQQLIKINQLTQ